MKKLGIFTGRTWGFMLIHQQERDLSRTQHIIDLCDLVN